MSDLWWNAAQEAAARWRHAKRVVVLTGAGVSVPSGIPDFRSPGGLWERYPPESVATVQALRTRPDKVWEFLLDAALLLGKAKPNVAHEALARLERAGRVDAVVTQNIDGLHQAAGSKRVIEFHGSTRRYYCMSCREDHDPDTALRLTPDELPWMCDCGGVIRPDIVFYGEHIPPGALSESLSLAGSADLAVIVGTSGTVAPANTLPRMVKQNGGGVLEFNLERGEFGSLVDVAVMGPAQETLPAVADLLGA